MFESKNGGAKRRRTLQVGKRHRSLKQNVIRRRLVLSRSRSTVQRLLKEAKRREHTLSTAKILSKSKNSIALSELISRFQTELSSFSFSRCVAVTGFGGRRGLSGYRLVVIRRLGEV